MTVPLTPTATGDAATRYTALIALPNLSQQAAFLAECLQVDEAEYNASHSTATVNYVLLTPSYDTGVSTATINFPQLSTAPALAFHKGISDLPY